VCQKSSRSLKPFGHNTPTLQTDRRTDGQTDRRISYGIGLDLTVGQKCGTRGAPYATNVLSQKIKAQGRKLILLLSVCMCHRGSSVVRMRMGGFEPHKPPSGCTPLHRGHRTQRNDVENSYLVHMLCTATSRV